MKIVFVEDILLQLLKIRKLLEREGRKVQETNACCFSVETQIKMDSK